MVDLAPHERASHATLVSALRKEHPERPRLQVSHSPDASVGHAVGLLHRHDDARLEHTRLDGFSLDQVPGQDVGPHGRKSLRTATCGTLSGSMTNRASPTCHLNSLRLSPVVHSTSHESFSWPMTMPIKLASTCHRCFLTTSSPGLRVRATWVRISLP